MPLIYIVFLLFLALPLAEIYVLLQVGGVIGVLPTVGLVVFTAVLGASLIRVQGLGTIGRIRGALERGEIPAVEVIEGAMLLVAGALLLTPGFITDTIGFVLLVPPVRRALALRFLRDGVAGGTGGGEARHGASGRVIEGDFRRED